LFSELSVNGTLVWYYHICKREVWLIGHGIEANQQSDFLLLGKHIQEIFYRKKRKEINIDNIIKIDLLPGGKVIGEVKKSSKYLESAKMQLAFYLYYMKYEKNVEIDGVLLFPEERKRIDVRLTEELERRVKETIEGIREILRLPKPPEVRKIPYCKNCAYKEFCFA